MFDIDNHDTGFEFANSLANLMDNRIENSGHYHHGFQEGVYMNGTLSDSDSGSDTPSTPATPTSLQCWEQVYLHDAHFQPDAQDASDGVTPPQSPYGHEFSYVPRGLELEQLTPTERESDPCQVVTNEGGTYAIINGFVYPIDPEVPDTVPGDEHPRPARKSQRAERLWEFLLRLLKDEKSNPSLIQWVDQSVGTFRLTNSKTIAQMWGRRKSNENMTYEKLSRAMRYYYARNILRPVLGKKLVYSFGPKARGWRPHEKA